MSKFTYSEIGEEVLVDVMNLFKPAVGKVRLDKEIIEGEIVIKEAPVGLIIS